jgi:WD40 repeat protein
MYLKFHHRIHLKIAVLLLTFSFAVLAQEGEGGDEYPEERPPQHYNIWSMKWHPHGSQIVVSYARGDCGGPFSFAPHLIDTDTRQEINYFVTGDCPVDDLAWNSSGTRLLGSSLSGQMRGQDIIRIWDPATNYGDKGVALPFFATDQAPDFSVSFWGNDDTTIISVAPPRVFVWDSLTGDEITSFDTGAVWSADLSPDGTLLAVATDTGISVWNIETQQEVFRFGTVGGNGQRVAWSPDGQKIATLGEDYTSIDIWNVSTSDAALTVHFTGHTDKINALDWNPDVGSEILASASEDTTVKTWDTVSGQMIETFPYVDAVWALDWSPDEQQLAYGGVTPNTDEIAPLEIVTPDLILPGEMDQASD